MAITLANDILAPLDKGEVATLTLLLRKLAGVESPSSARGDLARVGDRAQPRLDLGAQVFDERRQRELLAQALDRLVDREAGAPSVAISNRTPLGSRK